MRLHEYLARVANDFGITSRFEPIQLSFEPKPHIAIAQIGPNGPKDYINIFQAQTYRDLCGAFMAELRRQRGRPENQKKREMK